MPGFKRKTRQEKMDEVMSRLNNGITEFFTSEKPESYKEYLKVMSQFYRYSAHNDIHTHEQGRQGYRAVFRRAPSVRAGEGRVLHARGRHPCALAARAGGRQLQRFLQGIQRLDIL